MSGTEYPKIHSPYKRYTDGPWRGKLSTNEFARPEFEALWESDWVWTEKLNGTNVRVIWDGHKVRFGGRTDDAQMPIKLHDWLTDRFTEELLESQFHGTPAVLYGEGVGNGIAHGSGVYGAMNFVLFDVNIAGWWLLWDKVCEVAAQMSLTRTTHVFTGHANDAIMRVLKGMRSTFGDFEAEGLVGRPPCGLLGRDGDRLLVKVKAKDFPQMNLDWHRGEPVKLDGTA